MFQEIAYYSIGYSRREKAWMLLLLAVHAGWRICLISAWILAMAWSLYPEPITLSVLRACVITGPALLMLSRNLSPPWD